MMGSARGRAIGGGLLLAAIIGLWIIFDSNRLTVTLPKGAAEFEALAAALIGHATDDGLVAPMDLEVRRLLRDSDQRSAQLAAALVRLASLRAGGERRVKKAFAALELRDTGPAEALLTGLYEAEKSAPEVDLAATQRAAHNLAALVELRDSEGALNLYSEAAAVDEDQPAAWARLGHISLRAGRTDLAIKAYDMAMFLAGDEDHKAAVMTVKAGYGLIALRAGEIFETEANLREALALAEELDDQPHKAALYSNLGRILLLQSKLAEAEALQIRALTIERALDRPAGLAVINANLGMIHQVKSDFVNAVIFHTRALEFNEELGNKAGVAVEAANLGTNLKSRGDTEGACDQWRRALPLFETAGNASRTEQMRALIDTNVCVEP
ncbi:MAG: tetratricopeptide repeat protein [Alphaproteobacteria bacterium]|nr:tetratricopeptide repeat protein [Alphaproteobacteria bacterium]